MSEFRAIVSKRANEQILAGGIGHWGELKNRIVDRYPDKPIYYRDNKVEIIPDKTGSSHEQ